MKKHKSEFTVGDISKEAQKIYNKKGNKLKWTDCIKKATKNLNKK